MPAADAPRFVCRSDGVRLALRTTGVPAALRPTLLFLPGYASDMQGGKATALAAWAADHGHAMLRFDYAGCGESEGHFEDYTLDDWLADVLLMLDTQLPGPVIIVGSSMGGWLMLRAALARPQQVVGLIGIAAAPDFTRWGFSQDACAILARDGRLEEASPYADAPIVTTRAFWASGERHILLDAPIAIHCPVHLIHGQADPDVPWQIAVSLAERLESPDVALLLIKDGDHRLSRPADVERLISAVSALYDRLAHMQPR